MTARSSIDGEERHFRDIADSEALGIIIIHQELALVPLLSIAENIFLGNEPRDSASSTGTRPSARTRSCSPRSASNEVAEHADHQYRRRQAATGRDRQGARQEGEAADPRRADRQPQRKRQRGAARPAARIQQPGHRLDPDLAQAQRARRGRRPHHRAARRHAPSRPRLPGRARSAKTASSRAWSAAT